MIFNYQSHSLKPGIYRITNTTNGRTYVGQAKEFKRRWKQHASSLRNNRHQNKFLQHDFNKRLAEQGNDDFLVFEVVEVMEGSTKEQRNAREEVLIQEVWDKCLNCYNIKKEVAGAERSCFSKTPEETAQKLSAAHKRLWSNPEHREKLDAKRKQLWSDEQWREDALKKLQDGKRKALEDPAFRAELGNKISARQSTPEAREKTAALAKARWSDPEYKARVTASIAEGIRTEEAAVNRKSALESRKSDPEGWAQYQAKASNHTQKLWDTGVLTHDFSEETKTKMSRSAKQRHAEGRNPALEKHSFKNKTYQLLDPDGQLITITDLKQWCLERDIDYHSFRRLMSGEKRECLGYKLPSEV